MELPLKNERTNPLLLVLEEEGPSAHEKEEMKKLVHGTVVVVLICATRRNIRLQSNLLNGLEYVYLSGSPQQWLITPHGDPLRSKS